MTTNQSLALWELCRQGLPLAADDAAEQWGQGQQYELAPGVRVSRGLEALIEQCNWEVGQVAQAA
jgi:hypothetical protein